MRGGSVTRSRGHKKKKNKKKNKKNKKFCETHTFSTAPMCI